MSHPARSGVAAVFLLVCQTALGAGPGWQGAPLTDYIESLRASGSRIIYSSDLVRDEYRVQAEPRSADPEESLREVLAPYGLGVTEGPGDSLLITRVAVPESAVVVRVLDDQSGTGIPGAQISLDGETVGVTDGAGRLRLDDVTAGRHRVMASADGYKIGRAHV